MMSPANNAAPFDTFDYIGSRSIAALKLDVHEYRHRETGARHFHLAADNTENVFLVAFKTIPTDSTGVAHILEHTALCGSERYPVRDPFFLMVRRSLNTFMNAFTSSDWTAYPFASQNLKDFHNLLDVYLDCAFFARLDPLDFAQEGHRLEFEEMENPESKLVYKGVVYNEMKGAMSSPVSTLWQTLTKYLYPTTTYHYNSGGEPEHITDLTYDQLVAFYRKHYHPSNAIFMTYGNLAAKDLQQQFEEKALHRFKRLDAVVSVPDEKRYFSPVRVQESYPLASTEDPAEKTHVVMGWLLGHSFKLEQNLEAHLLSNVLLENSASPLMKALEKTELGRAPSPLCGLEDSNREMVFVCGLDGSEADRAQQVEQLILDVLKDVAEQGVSQERLEAILHQLELSQREIAGDHYPYGLQLVLAGLPSALHGGDPTAVLDLEPALASLREKIKDPDYIKRLVRSLLLDNPHRVLLTLSPDSEFDAQRARVIEEKLAAIKASLSEEEQRQIIEQSKSLLARQEMKEDEGILPKVGLADIPVDIQIPEPEAAGNWPELTCYGQGTNGIVYQQMISALPQIDEQQQQLLPLYTYCLTEVGAGERSYLEMQDWQSAVSGGISAYSEIKGMIDDEQSASGYLVLSAKALNRNQEAVSELMRESFLSARFDDTARVRELVSQIRARREQAVTSNGHALAMGAAVSAMAPSAALSYRIGGLEGIRWIKALDQAMESSDQVAAVCDQLQGMHRLLVEVPRQHLIVAEKEELARFSENLERIWRAADQTLSGPAFSLPPVRGRVQEAWLANTQVNFCAKAYPTVPVEHPDAAALSVLGGYLRNCYLHRAIREQGGAYGAGAGQDSSISAFRFYSYRDPRIEATLDDFDASVQWLLNNPQDPEDLEQAILGVISQIDKPRSPAGEAKSAFHSSLFGRTPEQRRRFRARILQVSLDDLRRVAQTYLDPALASTAIVIGERDQSVAEKLGLELKRL